MLTMDSFILPLLMGAPPQAGAAGEVGAGSLLTSFIPFIAIIAIFYLLIIRPQNKKRKETEQMLSALKKGDKIITIGGIHGVVQSVKEKTVIIKIDDNVKMEFSRSAISSVEVPSNVKSVTQTEEKTEDKPAQGSQGGEEAENKNEGQ